VAQIRKKRRSYHRRKVCRFCADSTMLIDYKDYRTLRYCAKHQRELTTAIKRARVLALLPFSATQSQ
jgi:small subunit ribosomal protein S18